MRSESGNVHGWTLVPFCGRKSLGTVTYIVHSSSQDAFGALRPPIFLEGEASEWAKIDVTGSKTFIPALPGTSCFVFGKRVLHGIK